MKYVLCLTALMCWSAAKADPAPAQDWSLSAVLQRVAQSNRDVLSAQRSVDAAQADQRTASVTPPAQFSLLSQSIDPQHMGSGSLWNRPIDTIARIDKTLERGGKAQWREQAAEAGVTAARHDMADTLRTRKIGAAQAYWDLKLAQAQWDISQRNWELAQASRDAAQLRLKLGDLSRLEATRLAVEAERAASELAQSRLQLQQARLALAQWLALSHAEPLHAQDNWPTASQPDMATDETAWLAAREDVKAAMARCQQAQLGLSLAQAQRSADVTVSVQFEHNPSVAPRLWGVGVAFPLGVDDRQQGPLARALIAVNEAQAQLDKTREQALAERALLQETWRIAMQRVDRLESMALPQARDALKGAEYAREQGALPLQDVLDARRALHAAELDAASAHADAAKAWTALTMTSDTNTVTP